MQIREKKIGECLLVSAEGRLDASWADYFSEVMLNHIRRGEHHLVLDVAGLCYISSAGIRALMLLYRELEAVRGTIQIHRADEAVSDTLRMSGLEAWLFEDTFCLEQPDERAEIVQNRDEERYVLNAAGTLVAEQVDAWEPWQPVTVARIRTIALDASRIGVGVGGAGSEYAQARDHLGEFVAVAGHVAVQPPDEHGRPDYLVAEQQFVPSLLCVEAWICSGEMSHLLRFRESDEHPWYPVSGRIQRMLDVTGADAVGFVIVGEIEGLVGVSLIRSPAALSHTLPVTYPGIKNWLSFCGERVYAREQALIAGVAARSSRRLKPLPSCPDVCVHLHAAVFPYQPLPNGRLEMDEAVQRLFQGPPPQGVMHLVDDHRSGIGLGESALLNGACWFAPIQNREVLR